MENPIPKRALGHVMEALESTGISVSHAFDDLIFTSYSALLLQFSEENSIINYYFVEDFSNEEKEELEIRLVKAFKDQGLQLMYKGRFSISQKEDEQIQIQFYPI